ncbi:hypothetical protein HK100_006757 [Physocladia obscura]|uniref:Uncharacterized protein n=1 Tax=Physocladia obscura TaxID=109957 RepID=A0AAD5XB62_9FUNG|nr:hypothetical protein HK100_006757 [Physocladia obscura]
MGIFATENLADEEMTINGSNNTGHSNNNGNGNTVEATAATAGTVTVTAISGIKKGGKANSHSLTVRRAKTMAALPTTVSKSNGVSNTGAGGAVTFAPNFQVQTIQMGLALPTAPTIITPAAAPTITAVFQQGTNPPAFTALNQYQVNASQVNQLSQNIHTAPLLNNSSNNELFARINQQTQQILLNNNNAQFQIPSSATANQHNNKNNNSNNNHNKRSRSDADTVFQGQQQPFVIVQTNTNSNNNLSDFNQSPLFPNQQNQLNQQIQQYQQTNQSVQSIQSMQRNHSLPQQFVHPPLPLQQQYPSQQQFLSQQQLQQHQLHHQLLQQQQQQQQQHQRQQQLMQQQQVQQQQLPQQPQQIQQQQQINQQLNQQIDQQPAAIVEKSSSSPSLSSTSSADQEVNQLKLQIQKMQIHISQLLDNQRHMSNQILQLASSLPSSPAILSSSNVSSPGSHFFGSSGNNNGLVVPSPPESAHTPAVGMSPLDPKSPQQIQQMQQQQFLMMKQQQFQQNQQQINQQHIAGLSMTEAATSDDLLEELLNLDQ